jgi:superoxide dismutase, Fe-Mn family
MPQRFQLPDLGYAYDALEPHIDARTMEIHHTKHHQTYTDKLNAALEQHADLQDRRAEDILRNIREIPDDIRTAVRNNGGGYVNHNIFWEIMRPGGSNRPAGEVARAIDDAFGSFDSFKEKFSTTAANQFGSGWAWLVRRGGGDVDVIGLPNQDSPYMEGLFPVMGIDVWEHAYYLKYQNRRPEYIQAWWNVVNWDEVNRRYEQGGR